MEWEAWSCFQRGPTDMHLNKQAAHDLLHRHQVRASDPVDFSSNKKYYSIWLRHLVVASWFSSLTLAVCLIAERWRVESGENVRLFSSREPHTLKKRILWIYLTLMCTSVPHDKNVDNWQNFLLFLNELLPVKPKYFNHVQVFKIIKLS